MSKTDPRVLFNPTILRNLGDKSYEKRKTAANEIESLVRQISMQPGSGSYILTIITTLATDYTFSSQPNSRKGGLIGLSSIAIALLNHATPYLELLLPPILRCFIDQDSRVRYYACEALYNIAKICRQDVLLYFNELFDGLCKLSADNDPDVRAASMLLDRLLKDIVGSCDAFNIAHFIPLLRERIRLKHPNVRLVLVNWISLLHSLYDVCILEFLPDLLSGLFAMLSDPHKDIKSQILTLLHSFLQQVVKTQHIEYSTMIFSIVQHATTNDYTTRHVITQWLHNFIVLGREQILPYLPHIVGALFCCINDDTVDGSEIRQNALHCNELLLHLVRSLQIANPNTHPSLTSAQSTPSTSTSLVPISTAVTTTSTIITNSTFSSLQSDFPTLISHFITQLSSALLHARIVSLKWLALLLTKFDTELFPFYDTILPPLLLALQSECDMQIFILIIECIAHLALLTPPPPSALPQQPSSDTATAALSPSLQQQQHQQQHQPFSSHHFNLIFVNLLSLFATDIKFLELRSQRILCSLATFIPPKYIFSSICTLLKHNQDFAFTKIMVETLQIVLFTTEEYAPLRSLLIESSSSQEYYQIFIDIFNAFTHSPIPAISLSLLSQNYALASGIVSYITSSPQFQITVGLLLQLEQFVQLFESSIFSHCRCHLLSIYSNPQHPGPSATDQQHIGQFEAKSDADREKGHFQQLQQQHIMALLHTLHSLLALLPQSHSFFTLKNRIEMSTIGGNQSFLRATNSQNLPNTAQNNASGADVSPLSIIQDIVTTSIQTIAISDATKGELSTALVNRMTIQQHLAEQITLVKLYISIQQQHDQSRLKQQTNFFIQGK